MKKKRNGNLLLLLKSHSESIKDIEIIDKTKQNLVQMNLIKILLAYTICNNIQNSL